jgi:hypothetical protein
MTSAADAQKKLHGYLSASEIYNRATAAAREFSADLCGWRLLRGQRNEPLWPEIKVFYTGCATISSK